MTAGNLAKTDGAPQSFTRSMYLCSSTPKDRQATPSAGTQPASQPFPQQAGTGPARLTLVRATAKPGRLQRAVRYFLTGLSTR